ncbi:MAG: IS1 family transposase [Desulfovibrionaceae bacterium]|nr:IS1 family transposase [Desulfovibrionaceae bacterium]
MNESYGSTTAKPNCPKCHGGAVYRTGKSWESNAAVVKDVGICLTTARGRPAREKALAITLYTMGLSLSAIARLFQVSPPAVLRWVRVFAERVYEKPESGEVVIVELDEIVLLYNDVFIEHIENIKFFLKIITC